MTSIFMVIGIVGWIALLTSIYVYKKAKDERLKSITIDDKESTDPNVVVIGGGTGQSVFLRGLKKRTRNITAIVTAKSVEPIKFAIYTSDQFLKSSLNVIFLFITANVIKLFPVNNSAPHITTNISPTGKTAAPISLATPGSIPANVWLAIVLPNPPNPINAPANIPSKNIEPTGKLAFPTPTLTIALAISFGAKNLFSIQIHPFVKY